MKTIYFLVTVLAILVLMIRIVARIIRRRPFSRLIKILSFLLILYIALWTISYVRITNQVIPRGTDICFDDWCVTMTSYTMTDRIGNQVASGQFLILAIKMTNVAQRIAQKPSEPRVHVIDENGHIWTTSIVGQQALERSHGYLFPLDQRLELNQSLETKLVFDVPKGSSNLKVLIEEGPFITKLLLRSDVKLFQIQ